MQIEITERELESYRLPPGAERARLWDSKLPGFGVVVGRRRVSFVAQRRVKGERTQTVKRLGHWAPSRLRAADPGLRDRTMSVHMARGAAIEALGDMRAGHDPHGGSAGRDGPTLRQALEYHVGRMARGENRRRKVCSPRSIATLRDGVELHLAAWLDRPLVELTADALDEVRHKIETSTERRAGANPKNAPGVATANRILANVSAIWRSWHKRHGLPVACPTDRLTAAALAPRETRVGNDELPAWYERVQALENHVRADLQQLVMFSAIRSDGARHLTWADIDWDEELIHVARAKGDRPYSVPMTRTLREIIERRRAEHATLAAAFPHCAPWVFPSPDAAEGCVAEPKERREVLDEDGDVVGHEQLLPGLHVARRTYNSVAMELAVPLEIRERLLNHAGRGVNVRHYGVPQDWGALRRWADTIEAGIWARIHGTWGTRGPAVGGQSKGKRGRSVGVRRSVTP